VAGYVGVPSAAGSRIERFLEPSFTVEAQRVEWELRALPPDERPAPEPSELGLMGLATAVAFAGIGVAWFFFLKRRDAAAALAQRFAGVYRLLLRKYYVDEVYQAAVVNPIVAGSEKGLWRDIDVGLIDGAVNGVGRLVRGASGVLRLAQTGSIRAYAASLFLGAVLVLAYLVLR